MLRVLVLALTMAAPASAEPFRTKATGMGAPRKGHGLVSFRASTDDPQHKIESVDVIAHVDCPFASKTNRRIAVSESSVDDLDNGRSCEVVRSWLCVRFRPKAAKSLPAADADPGTFEAAGALVIWDNGVATRVRRWTGTPKMGETLDGSVSGDGTTGYKITTAAWTAQGTTREVCLPDGIKRFIEQRDPALDAH